MDDLQPLIELYHHTVRAGQYDAACDLFYDRINSTAYYQLGAYELTIELLRALFPDSEDRPPRLVKEGDQAWTLNALANSYSVSGQPRRAVPLLEQANAVAKRRDNKRNLVIGLANLGFGQLRIGAFQAAEENFRRAVTLSHEIEETYEETVGHVYPATLLAYRGTWDEAETKLAAALANFEQEQDVQAQGITWSYHALQALLIVRSRSVPKDGAHSQVPLQPATAIVALQAAQHALELVDETARTLHALERDYVRAYWLLGAAHRVNGNMQQADNHLTEALQRCRRINAVDTEADILLELARLQMEAGTSKYPEARRLAREALAITERSGYVLQGADVHLLLAELALHKGDRPAALEHAQQARTLATCDGPPDYTYKVAYDEAGALLERLRGA